MQSALHLISLDENDFAVILRLSASSVCVCLRQEEVDTGFELDVVGTRSQVSDLAAGDVGQDAGFTDAKLGDAADDGGGW